MKIVKQGVDISFAKGIDTKTDAKRVPMGSFLKLENSVFTKGGLLQKRNGYKQLAALPNDTYSYLTTFNDNLTALGPNIAALNNSSEAWVAKGTTTPLSISTLPLIRNNLNQTACDAAIAPNGLVCTVYLETDGTTVTNKYAIADSVTGQNVVAPAIIPVASGVVSGGMRVFVLGSYFIIVFTNTIAATPHLQYVAISTTTTTNVSTNVDIASSYSTATTLAWDGYEFGGYLYLAYNTVTGGQQVKVTALTSTLTLLNAQSLVGFKGTVFSLTVDANGTALYVSFYSSSSSTGYTAAFQPILLNPLLAPTQIISSGTILNLASAAQNGICDIYGEVQNAYSFDAGLPTHFITHIRITIAGGVAPGVASIRSVGLASKAFIQNNEIYYLGVYQSQYQPTYFLINGSTSISATPVIAAKLAYENAGGYLTTGLPGTPTTGSAVHIPYLFKDLIQAVNKDTAVNAGIQVAGVYSQTGANLATFTFGTQGIDTAEIGNNLLFTGGFLSAYDGYLPVEQNFFLWPDTDQANPTDTAAWSATGGDMVAKPDSITNTKAYYYQITYEWTDNQGNAYRSAPSIPIAVTTTGSASTGSVTLNIPTLRLTMKTVNPVKIVIYRWSAGQQAYYQTTSITVPLLNDPTTDSVQYVDTNADSTILGNSLLYTTGGVLEDVNAPASDLLALFDTRLWLVDAEDPNLLWFSKQVIEATPVEMSDLLTKFVPPTVATATGKITSIYPMDDKLIVSKGGNSFVYINGAGPDNTGANDQYSEPIFITSTVGCANQRSIVAMPAGLMFQSNKGIWLLDRGLNTSYIGAPVEDLVNSTTVTSAVSVPETNQVRFTLDSGITVVYDYYYGQWSTFTGVPTVSGCIFNNTHTFINSSGLTFQEAVGTYLDGSNPVLMSFITGPLRLGDLQNYQRAFFFFLLGTYISPHKLVMSMYYNYSTTPSQTTILTPLNYSTPYGSGASQSPYGQGSPYGGPSSLERFRVFLEHQRCQAIGIGLQEVYDASFGATAGAGLTLSGINMVMAFKNSFPTIASSLSFGAPT